tara:strand:- start:96 stop:419 length:324 start_codon:yes stop_codon:yes gene_type:complete
MKVAVNFKVDLNKIDLNRAFAGANGSKTIDLTCFISPEEPDRFGQHGGIQQSTSKEERDQGLKMPYVGNVKAFWGQGVNIVKEEGSQSAKAPAPAQADFNKDDDIPF